MESQMIEELLGEIEGIAPNPVGERLHFLISCTQHEDSEVRFRSLERLAELFSEVESPPDAVLNSARAGLLDADELVRCAALEFFENHAQHGDANQLRACLRDASELVSGQAALTLANIGCTAAIDDIRAAAASSDSAVEKAPMFAALAILGVPGARRLLAGLLSSDFYQFRCAAANLLSRSTDAQENLETVSALRLALNAETTVAARSSIEDALTRLAGPD
jgi:hypothetical protein